MKHIYLMIFSFLIFAACQNQEEGSDQSKGDTPENQIQNENTVKKELPDIKILLKLAEKHKGIKDSLNTYLNLLSQNISSEDQILKVFDYRENIMSNIDLLVVDYLEPDEMSYDEALEKELNAIGFQGRYAEGMYFGLGVATILSEEIEQFASEELKLKIEFDVALASAYDTEYPFDSMDDEMEIVRIGELIIKQFPGSKTAEYVEKELARAVSCFTDFHKVVFPGEEYPTYIVGGIETDMYPNGSNVSNFKNFISEMPQSKYTKVVKTILNNPSTIEYSEEYLIYLVAVELTDDYEKAEEKTAAFIEKGIDIPHMVYIRQGENGEYAIVYRFFTDIAKAENALKTIQKKYKNAQIIAIDKSGQRVAVSDK